MKPLLVGIYRGITSFPSCVGWCEMDFVHPQYFPQSAIEPENARKGSQLLKAEPSDSGPGSSLGRWWSDYEFSLAALGSRLPGLFAFGASNLEIEGFAWIPQYEASKATEAFVMVWGLLYLFASCSWNPPGQRILVRRLRQYSVGGSQLCLVPRARFKK